VKLPAGWAASGAKSYQCNEKTIFELGKIGGMRIGRRDALRMGLVAAICFIVRFRIWMVVCGIVFDYYFGLCDARVCAQLKKR